MELAYIVIVIIILLFVVLPYLVISKKEKLISEMDYRQIPRGLSANNSGGYYPIVTFLSDVEHSKVNDFVPSG